MNSCTLVFPHQLFADSPALKPGRKVICVLENLFFRQFNFHQQKLAFHRATLEHFIAQLRRHSYEVHVVETTDQAADARHLGPYIRQLAIEEVHWCDPIDDWLQERVTTSLYQAGVTLVTHPSPMFLNTSDQIQQWYAQRGRLYQTDFYIDQRKGLQILVDEKGKPQGGKWSFDAENRLRYPKGKTPPKIQLPRESSTTRAARQYVEQYFGDNYGAVEGDLRYPVTRPQALTWLDQFLQLRFPEFGSYEDAIVLKEPVLHHSLLTPMLNVGLITPPEVIERTLDYAQHHAVPLASLEGFLRQIIGWREFIRAVYMLKGRRQRTRNFWGFTRKIPQTFWSAQTGIAPVDAVIAKVLRNAYCHHIERLMILGNFMLLCEFDPDDVYRWFMELFIDAYDWVMVPNVYGMSQFADGGLMATKPYISGSNYIVKMSDATRGPWQATWDALFWRFMHVHREFFLQNPRLGMLVGTFDRMTSTRREQLLGDAERFLNQLG